MRNEVNWPGCPLKCCLLSCLARECDAQISINLARANSQDTQHSLDHHKRPTSPWNDGLHTTALSPTTHTNAIYSGTSSIWTLRTKETSVSRTPFLVLNHTFAVQFHLCNLFSTFRTFCGFNVSIIERLYCTSPPLLSLSLSSPASSAQYELCTSVLVYLYCLSRKSVSLVRF